MDDTRRLELIAEAIRYCQRVSLMGMPASCYSKALREPIYFLWECRATSSKGKNVRYRSRSALGGQMGNGALIRDHAVPFRYLQSELLALREVTPDNVRELLSKYEVAVIITKSENDLLNAAGLQSKMPSDWDGRDPLARYKTVNIELVETLSIPDVPDLGNRSRPL
jgi:hypothetical protein